MLFLGQSELYLFFKFISYPHSFFPLSLHSHILVSSQFRHYSNASSSTKYAFILPFRVVPLIYFILYLKWLRQYYVCFSIWLLWIVLENRIYKSWYPQRVSFNTSKNRFSIKVCKEKECVLSLDNWILSWDIVIIFKYLNTCPMLKELNWPYMVNGWLLRTIRFFSI